MRDAIRAAKEKPAVSPAGQLRAADRLGALFSAVPRRHIGDAIRPIGGSNKFTDDIRNTLAGIKNGTFGRAVARPLASDQYHYTGVPTKQDYINAGSFLSSIPWQNNRRVLADQLERQGAFDPNKR